jgi:hypothetical protein
MKNLLITILFSLISFVAWGAECKFEAFHQHAQSIEKLEDRQIFFKKLEKLNKSHNSQVTAIGKLHPDSFDAALDILNKIPTEASTDFFKIISEMAPEDQYLMLSKIHDHTNPTIPTKLVTEMGEKLDSPRIIRGTDIQQCGGARCKDTFKKTWIKSQTLGCIEFELLCLSSDTDAATIQQGWEKFRDTFQNESVTRKHIAAVGMSPEDMSIRMVTFCAKKPEVCVEVGRKISKSFETLKNTGFDVKTHQFLGEARPEVIKTIIEDDLTKTLGVKESKNVNPDTYHSLPDNTTLTGNYNRDLRAYLKRVEHEVLGLKELDIHNLDTGKEVVITIEGKKVTYKPKQGDATGNIELGKNKIDTQRNHYTAAPGEEVRHGGTHWQNTSDHGGNTLPCPSNSCSGNDSPFIELDAGLRKWGCCKNGELHSGQRGNARIVMNTKNGDIFISFDHYETYHYIGSKGNKSRKNKKYKGNIQRSPHITPLEITQ